MIMSDEQQQDDQNQNGEITLEKLQTDFESAMAGWKRTAADFENYKRRKEGENKELVEFAREVTVIKLLPTIDSLELALRHMPVLEEVSPLEEGTPLPYREFAKQYQNWQDGINVLLKQLDKTLEDLGVKKIESIGKKFDPHFHEAVREVETEKDDGIIIDELQTGFELNGKVIRPSQVIISKKATKGGE